MAHIRNILNKVDPAASEFNSPADEIAQDESSQISDMGIAIYGGPTAIDIGATMSRADGPDCASQSVIDRKCHGVAITSLQMKISS